MCVGEQERERERSGETDGINRAGGWVRVAAVEVMHNRERGKGNGQRSSRTQKKKKKESCETVDRF